MEKKVILFAIGLFGIVLILFLGQQPSHYYELSEISHDLYQKKIVTRGFISAIKMYDTFQIISLQDSTGSIDVWAYDTFVISKNLFIEVEGTVDIYKGALFVVAESITVREE